MVLSITAWGSVIDQETSELGGNFIELYDQLKKSEIILECGQRPDHEQQFLNFPRKIKKFNAIHQLIYLGFFPPLEYLLRHDYFWNEDRKVPELPEELAGILVSHGHYDHVALLNHIRFDVPVYMNRLTKMLLYVWQYSSSQTVNQFVDVFHTLARGENSKGLETFLKGEESRLERNIKLFDKKFQMGNFNIEAWDTDHSIPGSSAFLIETSSGNVAFTGDIRLRGRYPERSQKYFRDIKGLTDIMICEGSLLHFDHQGREIDITTKIIELIHDKGFVGIAYPPRDLDRLTSIYAAAVATKRSLVITPQQAMLLEQFNEINNYPMIDYSNIAILMEPKNYGTIDKEKFSLEEKKKDYFARERKYLDYSRYDTTKGPQKKPQYVTLEDIATAPNQFITTIPQGKLLHYLSYIKEIQNNKGIPNYMKLENSGFFIRSHPAPWTKEMEISETSDINVLEHFGMYKGVQVDYLTPKLRDGSPNYKNIDTVHITGHMDYEETKEKILQVHPKILMPNHTMFIDYFREMIEGTDIELKVLNRGEVLTLD